MKRIKESLPQNFDSAAGVFMLFVLYLAYIHVEEKPTVLRAEEAGFFHSLSRLTFQRVCLLLPCVPPLLWLPAALSFRSWS